MQANRPVPFDVQNDNRAYRGRPRHKLHAQYDDGGWQTWLRYTQGGRENIPTRPNFAGNHPADLFDRGLAYGYRQLTLATGSIRSSATS